MLRRIHKKIHPRQKEEKSAKLYQKKDLKTRYENDKVLFERYSEETASNGKCCHLISRKLRREVIT